MPVTNGPTALPRIDHLSLLAGASNARSAPAQSARAIADALRSAPDEPEVRLAAYRFYFYAHDYVNALEQAQALLIMAARRMNIATDPVHVRPWDADFTAHDFAPGLYLQALIACGYCAARLGEMDRARGLLARAADLDPSDRFGGAWLLTNIDAVDEDDD